MLGFTPFYWEKENYHEATGISYMVRTEDFVLANEEGEFEASMFTYSYVRLPENKDRPVLFAYNGGPGSDSSWVHLGFLGPKIMTVRDYPDTTIPAEYDFTENPDFLLKSCDIVLINPAGTVHTVTTEEGKKKYLHIGGDGLSFVRLIEWWLKKYGREKAPVYLAGESYGTLRNTVIADQLPESIDLRGIIYIGVSLNVGSRGTFYVEPNVRRLGANAVTVWYHFHQQDKDKESFIKEAMDFAYGDYARALLLGNRLSEAEQREIAERLSYYTNLSPEKLLQQKLRFSEQDFLQEMYPDGVISTYDSRVTLRRSQMTSDGSDEMDFDNEPFMVKAGASLEHCMETYEREDIKVPEGRPSLGMMEINRNWSYATIKEDTLSIPEDIAKRRPALRQMFVNGYYDLQSTFDFVLYYLTQKNIPEDRLTVKFYDAGHAVYIGTGDTQKALLADVSEFVKEN